jgi:CHAT domain-containing protein
VLGQLRLREARKVPSGTGGEGKESLKLKLTELEAEAGLRFYNNNYENFLSRTSLIHFQQGLSKSEILLSFYLGEQHSYLWAVTRDSVQLYPLAPGTRIRADATRFRDAVRGDRRDARESAQRLYGELFGRLRRDESGKQAWLLSLDDALFETPVAALMEQNGAAGKGGKMKYLVEKHSLQVVPGALLLNRETGKPTEQSWFLGVGNPVYNKADSRWEQPRWYKTGRGWLARPGYDEAQLSTLVASAAEVESSARSWSGSTVLLEGANARREKFLEMVARGPGVIHLATHVLTPLARPEEALIAFGLESTGEIGYLANSEVAMLGVPGAIVSMTGCETGGGEVRAGAGLMGLTRAWQMAGARAVISTAWPVRDAPPAEAMRRSQVEMIHSGTWRASPSYWASYQVTGGRSLNPPLRGNR